MDVSSRLSVPAAEKVLSFIQGFYENTSAGEILTQTCKDTSDVKLLKRLSKEGYTNIPFIFDYENELLNERCSAEDYKRYLVTKFPLNLEYSNFVVDGTSCCGKSTLLQNFKTFKVNSLLPQEIGNYNFDSTISVSYFLLGNQMMKNVKGVALDRSFLANLAYQFAYFIMHYVESTRGKIEKIGTYMFFKLSEGETPFSLCERYTMLHHLDSVFRYVNAQRPNILILVDSQVESVLERMRKRGLNSKSLGDIGKSVSPLYVIAQNVAFSYVALKCNLFCLDLGFVRYIQQIRVRVKDTDDLHKEKHNDEAQSSLNEWCFLKSTVIQFTAPIESCLLTCSNVNPSNVASLELYRNGTNVQLTPFSANLPNYVELLLLSKLLSRR